MFRQTERGPAGPLGPVPATWRGQRSGAHLTTEAGCGALKPAVGSRNTHVVSTNGAVSADMPIGDSATVMAANTIALKIAPMNA